MNSMILGTSEIQLLILTSEIYVHHAILERKKLSMDLLMNYHEVEAVMLVI